MHKVDKKYLITLLIIIVFIFILSIVVCNNIAESQQRNRKVIDERDSEAFKILNNACDNLIDEEGNYNLGGPETEIVCEKGFCHINYQGENFGKECNNEEKES